jgi:hypothetical protein
MPKHVARRLRYAREADLNAGYYQAGGELPKPGGACQLCGKLEADHFAGMCNDWRKYTPAPVITPTRGQR